MAAPIDLGRGPLAGLGSPASSTNPNATGTSFLVLTEALGTKVDIVSNKMGVLQAQVNLIDHQLRESILKLGIRHNEHDAATQASFAALDQVQVRHTEEIHQLAEAVQAAAILVDMKFSGNLHEEVLKHIHTILPASVSGGSALQEDSPVHGRGPSTRVAHGQVAAATRPSEGQETSFEATLRGWLQVLNEHVDRLDAQVEALGSIVTEVSRRVNETSEFAQQLARRSDGM